MTLGVIGAGFGRTGTDSMREALEILGFAPCHHMRELIKDPEQKRLWRAIAAGAPPDWELVLGKYRACLDWPSAYYWPQLVEAFPEAKVLLTWRSAESWWASYEKTICRSFWPTPRRRNPRREASCSRFGCSAAASTTGSIAWRSTTPTSRR
jgi:hypothetical protein